MVQVGDLAIDFNGYKNDNFHTKMFDVILNFCSNEGCEYSLSKTCKHNLFFEQTSENNVAKSVNPIFTTGMSVQWGGLFT